MLMTVSKGFPLEALLDDDESLFATALEVPPPELADEPEEPLAVLPLEAASLKKKLNENPLTNNTTH